MKETILEGREDRHTQFTILFCFNDDIGHLRGQIGRTELLVVLVVVADKLDA